MTKERYPWTQEELDNIFDFIRENKDKFNRADPSVYHGTHFLNKLGRRFKQAYVSLRPYMIKVVVTAFLLWFVSFFVWGNWINPDRDKKSYASVDFEHRMKEYKYKYYVIRLRLSLRFKHLKDYPEIRADIRNDLRGMDLDYDDLQRDLKTSPGNIQVLKAMENYYKLKIKVLYDYVSLYKQNKNIVAILE